MEQQGEELTPSYHGELCSHNGGNPNFEIACDECDYYLVCFPDWCRLQENNGFDHVQHSTEHPHARRNHFSFR